MIGAFIVTFFFLMTSLAVAELGINHYTSTRRTLITAGSLNASEAGADAFMNNINTDTNYQGTTNAPPAATNSCSGFTITPVVLVNNPVQGKITYESCVTPGTIPNEKIVYSTGKVYLPATAASPRVTRKLKLVINQSLPTGFTIMSGPGGLVLGNNVRITAGPVYVGGKLSLSNNSTIGSVATPATTYVADIACPVAANSTYPVPCASGNSITTNINSHVYGDVHVLNNVDTPANFTNAGVVDHNVPPINLPAADHNTLTAGLANSGAMAAKNCSGGTMHLSGHYTGSVATNLAVDNNCTVYLDGNVWIDGNLILGNNDTLKVGPAVGSPINLIIDGSTGFNSGNNAFITASDSSVGLSLYTFWSADSSCTPNCANVTGTALATSQGVTTINLANNAGGSANVQFYARWSKLVLSNNATVGQLIGQAIDLNNNGDIQFSNSGAGTPSGWDVRYYEQLY